MSFTVWVNIVSLIVGVIAGGGFLIRYMIKVPQWWREEHRAHVVSFSGIVWFFYVLYAVRTLADPSTGPGSAPSAFNFVRMIMFVALTLIIVWRWWIFERGLLMMRRRAAAAQA